VNAFQEVDEKPMDTLVLDPHVETNKVTALKRAKQNRDGEAVKRNLQQIRKDAAAHVNVFPALLEAAKARCTVGEIMNAMADVFGRYDGAARW
jgi:Methylmalonyl-CoA mutase, N-terminal domain/subunit